MSSPHHDQIERWSGFKTWLYSLIFRNPASNTAVVDHAGVGEGDVVLDIGCGPGASLEIARSRGAQVFGVDPSEGMVRRASARVPEATVVEGSAEKLDFPDDQFTHVWTISAFHHWAHPESGMDEVHRVLAEGGRFLLVERELKEGKEGHGLSPGDADNVAKQMAEHGFRDCQVDRLKAKRAVYLVVSGQG